MHLFYHPTLDQETNYLSEEESKHCIQVLRGKPGDLIHLTDGKGLMAIATIVKADTRRCSFEIIESTIAPKKSFYSHIAIAPTKQAERMEWFVEKACELGVDEISFIKTKNSERPLLKLDRLEKKTISALKQSKGGYKTRLNPMVDLKEFLLKSKADHKHIAVVDSTQAYINECLEARSNQLILIGPEGDFTSQELKKALTHGFNGVSLGAKVLRTETAGVMAAVVINLVNNY
ncbi:MAG: 16S rRNA (uracil(1498)-N(3))-methyltransferase [Flammeovirgaceae bacterium]|jgi:16S rRNA (uracil1498-N3)-methyltransferase|nr:16S rRNA (uracil(1498)-N(3))-methyltransferase [Flammeovirgaceae bacterium]|tara:strand:- start:19487 stop:20185 length:699 start_codon:yes stop_codon:yes gene_type:complete